MNLFEEIKLYETLWDKPASKQLNEIYSEVNAKKKKEKLIAAAKQRILNTYGNSAKPEDFSSYILSVGDTKIAEGYALEDKDALKQIILEIAQVPDHLKPQISLGWHSDEQEFGDMGGDLLVSIYSEDELDLDDELAERTISNWKAAEEAIKKVLY